MNPFDESITHQVQARYGAVADQLLQENRSASCCESPRPTNEHPDAIGCCTAPTISTGTSCCGSSATNTISQNLYRADEVEGIPLKTALASLGCGNPTAVSALQPGEIVLDLGSGGGLDVLLSARRVGPSGFAYGLDMTESMLTLARHHAQEAGITNVEFLHGNIARIPLPDASVDVIISNCVINLAPDKAPVLHEAFRVLKSGGRFAVADIVIEGGLPQSLEQDDAFRRDLESWAGCIAGALTDVDYRRLLADAGFHDITLEVSRRYTMQDIGTSLPAWVNQAHAPHLESIVERFTSMTVRAKKP